MKQEHIEVLCCSGPHCKSCTNICSKIAVILAIAIIIIIVGAGLFGLAAIFIACSIALSIESPNLAIVLFTILGLLILFAVRAAILKRINRSVTAPQQIPEEPPEEPPEELPKEPSVDSTAIVVSDPQ